jgi:hypothetical protein
MGAEFIRRLRGRSRLQEITPIILIGMNRSGTKWVSNILCSHEEVIGAQSERSTGILETNMFGAMQDRFDLSDPDEYVGFLELWAKTELFRRTGVAKEVFYRLSPRPRSFLKLFDLLMSEFARKNGKAYWLQKTSPLRALAVLEYFKNARVIIVRRNLIDTLKSTWGLQMRHGSRRILRSIYAYVRQHKIMDQIAKNHTVVEVHYEVLKMQTAGEVARICRELGLDPDRISTRSGYAKNTSFNSESQRESIMSGEGRIFVRCAAALINLIPLGVMSTSAALKARLVGRRPIPLMPGSFGDLIDNLEDRSRGNN